MCSLMLGIKGGDGITFMNGGGGMFLYVLGNEGRLMHYDK